MTAIWSTLNRTFRRLRWRLTLSYTAVTVGALTAALVIAGILLFSQILMPTGMVTPDTWLRAVSQNKSPMWSYILAQSPIDTEMVALLLDTVEGADFTVGRFDLLRVGSLQLTAQVAGQSDVFIVDAGGTLLGATNSTLAPASALGQPIDTGMLPAMEAPLRAALAGYTEPASLYAEIEPNERFILAVPIFDDSGVRLLGAGIVHVHRLPTSDDLPVSTLTLTLRGTLLFLLVAGVLGAIFGLLTANGMARRFERLSHASAAWSRGDFGVRIDDTTGDEISQLAGRLDAMAGQLQQLLARMQQTAISEERNRLARDLHDSAKQQALAASFQLGTALTLFESDPPAARHHLADADALVDSVRRELTDLIYELRPAVTDERDFGETLREYVAEWAHQNGIEVDLSLEMGAELPLQTKGELYRILQEALANVARHSGAGHVTLSLRQDGAGLALTVSDDGCGFDVDAPAGDGMGLRSMAERAAALGGSLHVESRPDDGTTVTAMAPVGRP